MNHKGKHTQALESFAITSDSSVLKAGIASGFSAIATYKNGDVIDVTDEVTWQSDEEVLTPSSTLEGGKKLFVPANKATVTQLVAKIDDETATSIDLTVLSLREIKITSAKTKTGVDASNEYKAFAVYSDGSTEEITSKVTWVSGNQSIATADQKKSNTFVARTYGTATISASWLGATGKSTFIGTDTTPVSLAITPTSLNTNIGLTRQFTAQVTYVDQSTEDITDSVVWDSSDATIAAFQSTAGLLKAIGVGAATVSASFGGITAPSVSVNVGAAILTSITVTPSSGSLALGLTRQYTATGIYSDGTSADLTASAAWSSSSTSTATINASTGLATSVAIGSTTISAEVNIGGVITGSTTLNVSAAQVASIAITPSGAVSVIQTLTSQLTATATMTDSSTQDVTTQVTWSSGTPSVATISGTGTGAGLITAVSAGTSLITATINSVNATKTITVTNPTLVSIAVTPATTASLPIGLTLQLTATGTYSDSSTADITSTVTWSSSDATKVSVGVSSPNLGKVTSVALGTATITATLSAVSNTADVTATAPSLVSIAVTPASVSKAKGLTQQFTATGTYSDNSTADITSAATWSASGGGAVATISNGAGTEGLASTVASGSATMTATLGSVSNTATLTVTAPTVVSIAVTPANPTVALGLTQQFTATATYTDSSTSDVTSSVTWSKTNGTGAATISSGGLATTTSVGTVTITATSGSITGNTTLTVGAKQLVSIAVTPATPSIALGLTQQFTATGTYTDSSTTDITGSVTWTKTDGTGSATISAGGLATTTGTGTVTITATSGSISNNATLTVSAKQVTSIAVTPANPSVSLGSTQQFVATATYTDATTADISGSVTWSRTNGTGSATVNSSGLASTSGGSAGTVTITATSGSISGNTTMTITSGGGATLVSIDVTPHTPSIGIGETKQFTATGTYSDSSTQDITSTVTWTSSDTGKATIASTGIATFVGAGSTTITATLSAVSGNTTLTTTATIDAQNQAFTLTATTYSIGGGSAVTYPASTAISVSNATSSVTINGTSAATNTLTLTKSAGGINVVLNSGSAITLDSPDSIAFVGSSGADTLTISNSGGAFSLPSGISFNGSTGSNTIVGPDATNTWNITATNGGTLNSNITFVSVGTLTGGSGDDTFNFNTGGFSLTGINAGTGNDVFNFSASTTVTGSFTGSGNNTFKLPVDAVTVTGTVTGGSGTDIIDYTGRSAAVAVTVTASGASGYTVNATGLANGTAGINNIKAGSGTDTLTGRGATSTWTIDGTQDTYSDGSATTLSFSAFENLTGGALVDTFAFKNNAVHAGTIAGGSGSNIIDYSDASNTNAVTVTVTASAAGYVNASANAFTSGSNFKGTPQADTYLMTTNTAAFTSIAGSGGADTLDYTGRTTAVTINLNAGTVSAMTISGIYNATGGSGNDTLIGDSNDNVLNGAAGNNIITGNGGNDTISATSGYNIMIGGAGTDTITGGSGADIIIGGASAYDTNTTALTALMSEWSSGSAYATKVGHLTGTAGGLNGAYNFTSGNITDDSVADSLTGGAGVDWFITNSGDTVTDLNTGGAETQTNY